MTKAMIIRLYLDSDIEIGQILQDGMVPPSVPMTVVKAFTQVHIQTEGFCYRYKHYSVHPELYYERAFEPSGLIHPLYTCCCRFCTEK